jgi:hypothetical protein
MTGCDAYGCESEAVKYFKYQRKVSTTAFERLEFRYGALCPRHCDRAASYARDDEYNSCSVTTFEEWLVRPVQDS